MYSRQNYCLESQFCVKRHFKCLGFSNEFALCNLINFYMQIVVIDFVSLAILYFFIK